jgi:hypothetical protein
MNVCWKRIEGPDRFFENFIAVGGRQPELLHGRLGSISGKEASHL